MKLRFNYCFSILLLFIILSSGFIGCAAPSKSKNQEAQSVQGSPILGDPNAPIKIVEFTDFECHFCGLVQPALQRALKTYPTQVSLTFKSFPLGMHRHARMAHMAAMCANEQGKFWKYRNVLFQNQRNLKRSDLTHYAKELGLNLETFSQCVDDEKFAAKIEADMNEGIQSGVIGTPTFFVNGESFSGAQPFEAFDELIKKKLSDRS